MRAIPVIVRMAWGLIKVILANPQYLLGYLKRRNSKK